MNKVIFLLAVDRHQVPAEWLTKLPCLLPSFLLRKELQWLGAETIPTIRESYEEQKEQCLLSKPPGNLERWEQGWGEVECKCIRFPSKSDTEPIQNFEKIPFFPNVCSDRSSGMYSMLFIRSLNRKRYPPGTLMRNNCDILKWNTLSGTKTQFSTPNPVNQSNSIQIHAPDTKLWASGDWFWFYCSDWMRTAVAQDF